MNRAFIFFRQFLLSSAWFRHGIFWLCFLSLCDLIGPGNSIQAFETRKLLLGVNIIQIIHFYSIYGLYTLGRKRDSLLLLVIGITAVSVATAWVGAAWFRLVYPESRISIWPIMPVSVFFSLLVVALKFGKDMYVWQQEEFTRKQQQSEMELSFLKAQISPHFLFNTLNNLYGHAVAKSDLLPDMMLKLSDLLRYTLYDSDKPFVPLEDELNYIKNYMALEKMRLSKNSIVKFDLPDAAAPQLQIAPLMLICFVENAFKHSRHTVNGQCRINCTIQVDGNILLMRVENSYNPDVNDTALVKREGGVGLENARKRLELVYPNRYELQNSGANGIYKLNLRIEL